ncbi:MAG: hypothetical protein WCA81_07855, partial [Rhizomicrobium sp.]
MSESVLRAWRELEYALSAAGFAVEANRRIEDAGSDALRIVVSNFGTPLAAAALKRARIAVPDAPESLVLLETTLEGRPAILACGSDARGMTYALLELADRVRHGDTALKIAKPIVEHPANPVRSVMRQFVSETYDKPWFYDRAMWPRYFGMLAAQRFNRLTPIWQISLISCCSARHSVKPHGDRSCHARTVQLHGSNRVGGALASPPSHTTWHTQRTAAVSDNAERCGKEAPPRLGIR